MDEIVSFRDIIQNRLRDEGFFRELNVIIEVEGELRFITTEILSDERNPDDITDFILSINN